MKPEDLWVLFNKITAEVLRVFALREMAERHADKLVSQPPLNGTTPNKEKIMVCTLQRALDEINARHLEEINDKETTDIRRKWEY